MGIKFSANVGIDMTAIDFSNLLYGTPTKATSSEYVLKYGGGFRDEFEGHGFKYSNNGVPNGGRVESFTEFRGSKELFSIEGLHVVVTALVKAAMSPTLNDDANLIIRAMSGNDTVLGSKGNDFLYAGGGQDHIDGKGGRDTILSGPGADTMGGGAGADTFLFVSRSHSSDSKPGRDTITDFGSGDVIDLSNIGASDFVGTDKFSGDRGEVRFDKMGGNTIIEVDFNGDKKADFAIRLDGTITLNSSDFDL